MASKGSQSRRHNSSPPPKLSQAQNSVAIMPKGIEVKKLSAGWRAAQK
tara:strand:+ start:3447 stop:3590 length:144 start_codon:yes stop_codon:yes gene_type:complete